MASDQQFCLRWNNHQSTLVSVFDNLLESQTLVDCTLAADGQYLKAHKVVLSACSPYLEAILCQNLDKHPILILKDVKFSELKAMLDYMYRGEVNISQEQLSTFLKAAESLQIKGLTDSGGGGINDRDPPKRQDLRKPLNQPVPHIPQPRPVVPHPGLMERRSLPHFPPHIADMQPQSPRHAREGSTSPTARKRRRPNRPSSDDSNFVSTPNSLSENQPDTSDSCDVPVKQATSSTPNVPNATTKAPETDSNRTTPQPQNNQQNSEQKQQVTVKKEFSETLLTPKTEFDYGNDNSMEDVTYEDDEEEEVDLSKPGTSFAANSQGFPPWQMGGDGSNDDSNNMYSQDVTAATNQNNSQDPKHICERCGKGFTEDYRRKLHIQFFCAFGPGKNRKNCDPDTPRICYICSAPFRTAKMMRRHLIRDCRTKMRYQCQMCNYESHWAFMYQKHMSRVHHELMEVIDSVMKEQQSQQCAGEEEEERMEVYGQEVGDEEEMRNMEDRVIVENYELGAEYDEKSMVEAENEVGAGYEEESMIEAENEVGIENEDHLEDQFVEREENQIGSELGSISGADTIIDLTNSEEYELGDVDEITRLENMKENGTESKKENFRDLAAATSVINDTKSETENISRKEMETDNTETQESTNRLYLEDLEKKQMFKEKVYENLSKKSKALPTFQFDFVKPVKMTMDSSSRDHSETKIKTHKERKIEKRRHSEKENYCKKKREENKKKKRDSGDTKIKTHKERKIEKRRHSEKENYCRKKREENKKKKRDSGDKKKAHNGRCSHSNDNAMNEQKTVVETEKRNEEAVVPTMNIGLDSWLEGLLQSGLPRMSDEDFERLKASDPIFQFLVVNLS